MLSKTYNACFLISEFLKRHRKLIIFTATLLIFTTIIVPTALAAVDPNTKWASFNDMFTAYKTQQSGDNDFSGKVHDKQGILASFYNQWSSYLTPTNAIWAKVTGIAAGGLLKLFYNVTAGLETIYDNMFRLFGFFDYFGNDNTIIGSFYKGFQKVGIAMFIMLLVAYAIYNTITAKPKYKTVLANFIMVTFVVAVLPASITKVASTVRDITYGVKSYSAGGASSLDNMAIMPIHDNVVDLKKLIDSNFDNNKYPTTTDGLLTAAVPSTDMNTISTSNVNKTNFGASFGVTDIDLLDDFEEETKGYKGLFLHQLNANGTGISTITTHKVAGGLNNIEEVYPRYKYNLLPIIVQYCVLIFVLFSMMYKLAQTVIELIQTSIITPVRGYMSVASTKGIKEILSGFASGFGGIIFEVVILRISLEIMRDLPRLAGKTLASGETVGFFSGMNGLQSAIAAIIVYLAVLKVTMQGLTKLDAWLGVSTGHQDSTQNLMGNLLGAAAITSGARGMINSGKNLPHTLANGARGIMNAPHNVSQGIKKAKSAAANGAKTAQRGVGGIAGKTAGIASNVKDAVSESGVTGAVANAAINSGMGQTVAKGVDVAKDIAEESMDQNRPLANVIGAKAAKGVANAAIGQEGKNAFSAAKDSTKQKLAEQPKPVQAYKGAHEQDGKGKHEAPKPIQRPSVFNSSSPNSKPTGGINRSSSPTSSPEPSIADSGTDSTDSPISSSTPVSESSESGGITPSTPSKNSTGGITPENTKGISPKEARVIARKERTKASRAKITENTARNQSHFMRGNQNLQQSLAKITSSRSHIQGKEFKDDE